MLLRVILLLVLSSTFLSAQIERVLPRKGASSLEGTSFVVGFMQNEVPGSGEARLQIFIASSYNATVTIDYITRAPVTVLVPENTVYVENVDTSFMVSESQQRRKKSIFITSDEPIIVYTLNTLLFSTDTYTALPIKYLGKDYYTVNRPNDQYYPGQNNSTSDTALRSGEFMIMAVEDFTDVTITPTSRTYSGNASNVPFNVVLNRGEAYLVKSDRVPLGNGDLTGSRVQSTKPIALLSGHVRTSIPTNDFYSKDHLVEMLPSVDKWGKIHVTTPFAVTDKPDRVRIIASAPNTSLDIVTQSGTQTVTFSSAGEFREWNVTDVALWRANQPVMVVQFMPSSNDADSTLAYDPAMVIVPPLENYVEGALIQFPEFVVSGDAGQKFFYYVNLVCERRALNSLKINGVLVSDLTSRILTQRVPGTTLYWAQVRLAKGVYSIAADSGLFSGVMYGTSDKDSYANLFGVRYDSIVPGDRNPPRYSLDVVCGNITGTISDVSRDTALLTEVTVKTNQTFNYWWVISDPIDAQGSVDFVANVRDRWADARIVIHAYDRKGNGKEWMYFYDAPFVKTPSLITVEAIVDSLVCVDASIINKDTTPVTIQSITISGDAGFSLSGLPAGSITVTPGDSVSFQVCFTASGVSKDARAEVVVTYPCDLNGKIPVKTVVTSSLRAEDYDFGKVRIGDTVCATVPIINNGSDSIRVDSLISGNGSSLFVIKDYSPDLPGKLGPGDTVLATICFVPDSVADESRTDTVASGIGNSVTSRITGRGVRPVIQDVIIDFGKRHVGISTDTIVKIYNVGESPAQVRAGSPVRNETAFTFDQPGLPAAIPALDSIPLRVRFQPDSAEQFTDTVPMIVDWRYHESVRIIVIGEGVLPTIVTYDIDFGNVVVGQYKDSAATLVETGGNEALTVYSVTALGPDASAFSVPQNVMAMSVVGVAAAISDSIRFTPSKLGQHTSVYRIEHNAVPGSGRATSEVRLFGNGHPVPYLEFNSTLLAPSTILACVDTPIEIVLTNTGTLSVTVDTILVSIGTVDFTVNSQFPLAVKGGESVSLPVVINVDRNSGTEILSTVYYNGSSTINMKRTFSVQFDRPIVTSAAVIDGAPGNVASIEVNAETDVVKQTTEDFKVRVTAPGNKWVISDRVITAVVSDAISASEQVDLIPQILPDGALLTLARAVQAPYQVRFTVSGDILWLDPKTTSISFAVLETPCSDEGQSESALSIQICSGQLRMVKFSEVPFVTATLREQPVDETLALRFESTKNTYVTMEFVTLSGRRFLLVDNYQLEKGITDVNFSVSEWTPGIYNLHVRHSNGDIIVPVLLVK